MTLPPNGTRKQRRKSFYRVNSVSSLALDFSQQTFGLNFFLPLPVKILFMVNPDNPRYRDEFSRLLKIMNDLRAGCPWDKKQTMQSLRPLSIEEVYELSDAIMENNLEEVKKELGDLLLHIVFYSKIASETQTFDIGDVLEQVCEKLIRRHPHIYGDAAAGDADEVRKNWEKIKEEENKGKDVSILAGVPNSLPALIKAVRIQEKARGVGFDWEEKSQVWEKVEEEMNEFRENFDAASEKILNREEAEKEFGDLLFSLVNYARFIGIDPENALEKTNRKFISRFQYMERETAKLGKKISEFSLAELDKFWNDAKSV